MPFFDLCLPLVGVVLNGVGNAFCPFQPPIRSDPVDYERHYGSAELRTTRDTTEPTKRFYGPYFHGTQLSAVLSAGKDFQGCLVCADEITRTGTPFLTGEASKRGKTGDRWNKSFVSLTGSCLLPREAEEDDPGFVASCQKRFLRPLGFLRDRWRNEPRIADPVCHPEDLGHAKRYASYWRHNGHWNGNDSPPVLVVGDSETEAVFRRGGAEGGGEEGGVAKLRIRYVFLMRTSDPNVLAECQKKIDKVWAARVGKRLLAGGETTADHVDLVKSRTPPPTVLTAYDYGRFREMVEQAMQAEEARRNNLGLSPRSVWEMLRTVAVQSK